MLRGISKQQKQEMLHACLNKFPRLQKVSRYRFCIALYGRSGNKQTNLKELKSDAKFCETEAEDFQVIFHILLA